MLLSNMENQPSKNPRNLEEIRRTCPFCHQLVYKLSQTEQWHCVKCNKRVGTGEIANNHPTNSNVAGLGEQPYAELPPEEYFS